MVSLTLAGVSFLVLAAFGSTALVSVFLASVASDFTAVSNTVGLLASSVAALAVSVVFASLAFTTVVSITGLSG